jgi:hypothetical protein
LEQYRKARLDGGALPTTVNKDFRNLQAMFECAVKRGYLKANPFKGNRKALMMKVHEKNPVTLDPGQFRALLTACRMAVGAAL